MGCDQRYFAISVNVEGRVTGRTASWNKCNQLLRRGDLQLRLKPTNMVADQIADKRLDHWAGSQSLLCSQWKRSLVSSWRERWTAAEAQAGAHSGRPASRLSTWTTGQNWLTEATLQLMAQRKGSQGGCVISWFMDYRGTELGLNVWNVKC